MVKNRMPLASYTNVNLVSAKELINVTFMASMLSFPNRSISQITQIKSLGLVN